jgi:histidine ammonia-lyase
MGGTSAYKLCRIVENCEYVQAIELLTAAQAVDFNENLRLSPTTREIHDDFRRHVSFLEGDRVLSDDIEKSLAFFRNHKAQWSENLDLG